MRRGFSARAVSQSSPNRAITPGRKFCTSTSALLHQPTRHRLAAGLLQVKGEAPLVPMGEEEEGAHPVEEVVGAGPVALPESPAGRLDLHDVGAEVGEELHPRRAQEELGEADHAHALEDGERRAAVRRA